LSYIIGVGSSTPCAYLSFPTPICELAQVAYNEASCCSTIVGFDETTWFLT
jgi:hypothetical protein